MHWITATLLVVGIVSPTAAQTTGTLRGRISGDRAQPIVGATVRIVEAAKMAQSAEDGTFRIPAVAAGRHHLIIRAIGWKTLQATIEISPGVETVYDARLEADPLRLEDVVVSVSREAQSRRQATASIGVIDQSTLATTRPHHPADVVNQVAGVWVANLSGEGHMTAIRQPITTKPVYAYLEDGVPIRSTGFFNHNALYEINVPQADRVEIIKGPGSALYGSDAIGGVINTFTRAPSERPTGELFVEGGRFGYARVLGTASSRWGRDGLRADVNLTRADSYRDGAPYTRQSGTVRWDRPRGATTLKAVVAYSHIEQPGDGGGDLPETDYLSNPAINYTPVAFREVTALRASASVERRAGLSLVSATAYGRYNSLDLLPSWQLSFDPQVWASKNTSAGLLARVRRTVLPLRSNVSVGVDLEVSPGSRLERLAQVTRDGSVFRSYTAGAVQYDYDVTFWQAAPYTQIEVTPWGRLKIDAGLRLDYVGFDYANPLGPLQTGSHRRPASTAVSYQRLSPKIGANLEVAEGLFLFASYRAAFRAPSESQLFRQGSAVSTVDLKPVTADNYEAGVRAALGRRVDVEATAYQLAISNDILSFFNPTNGLRTSSNAGATRHRGVELGASVRPAASLRFDGSWAFTNQRYRSWKPNPTTDYSGNEIELAPRTMGRLGASWLPSLTGRGSLNVEWVHLGSYYMDPQNTEEYAGHDLFNVAATVPLGSAFDVVGRLQNVADTRFAETSSYTALQGRRLRPGPPRTFYLGAQYRFGRAEGGR